MGQKVRSQKWKKENAFYINPKTKKIQFNKKCRSCIRDCKQSYKAEIVKCPCYISKFLKSAFECTQKIR